MGDFWKNFISGFRNIWGTGCSSSPGNSPTNHKISKYINSALKYYENEFKKIESKK